MLASVSGCYATVRSSSAHLTAQQSSATVTRRVGAATDEIVRLFAARNITLVDERPLGPGDSRLLKLVGDRRQPAPVPYGERHTVDSVYYARVEPTVTGATVQIVGKPAVDGVEPCTADPGFTLPCSNIRAPEELADSVDGYQEAQLIYNLLVELRYAASGR